MNTHPLQKKDIQLKKTRSNEEIYLIKTFQSGSTFLMFKFWIFLLFWLSFKRLTCFVSVVLPFVKDKAVEPTGNVAKVYMKIIWSFGLSVIWTEITADSIWCSPQPPRHHAAFSYGKLIQQACVGRAEGSSFNCWWGTNQNGIHEAATLHWEFTVWRLFLF